MNLKQSPDRRNGRIYLSIVKGYRDNVTGKSRAKTILSLGYLDELINVIDDPIAHFKEVAKQMTEEENAGRSLTLTINLDEIIPASSDYAKNLGYAAIMKVFHELDLPRFLANASRNKGFQFNTASIMALLVISRMLSPGSKKRAFDEKGRYFERFDFSLADVYRALSHFSSISKEAQRHISDRVKTVYGRDTTIIYYDVTNYYFEIDGEDNLRKRGVSKERRKDPIVQIGLTMDMNGVPLNYELFEGNMPDVTSFRSAIGEVRRNYDTGRVIVVADKGVISGDNIFYLVGGEKRKKPQNGYVLSYSIRGSNAEFQSFVTDPNGYYDPFGNSVGEDTEFMIKSRLHARDIQVTMANGRKTAKTVYEKQVVFWSLKHALRTRVEREQAISRAQEMVSSPDKLKRATSYGAAKYVQNIRFDRETGEVLEPAEMPILDEQKILQEERYDGYYAIVTSETDMSDADVVAVYRGLWEIEETFRITKGTLEARPVYVSREDHINAHFLTCFIALVIVRLLQKVTDRRFSADRIVDCLNSINCTSEQDNLYLFGYRSEVSDAIGSALGIDFSHRRMLLSEIKSLLADSKKTVIPVEIKRRKRQKATVSDT